MRAIKNGKILTITNGVIEKGVVLIEKGKIKAVGRDINIPADAKIINANRKVIMPGLVETRCHIGIWARARRSTCSGSQSLRRSTTSEGNLV